MKKLVTYILLFSFLFRFFEVGLIFIDFKLHQDYLAEVLCINKDKPELNCNGCCQLKKELKEQSDREEKSEEFVFPEKLLVYTNASWHTKISYYPRKNLVSFIEKGIFYPKTEDARIFHPPKC